MTGATGPRLRKHAEQRSETLAAAVAKADELLVDARRQFTVALLAHARHQPTAALETRAALLHLDDARDVLRKVAEDVKP